MKALSKKNKILLGIGSGLLTVGVFIPVTVLLTKKKDKIQITKEHFENYYNQSVQTLYSQACANDNVSQSNSVAFDVACAFVNDFEIERSNYFSGLDSNSSKKDYWTDLYSILYNLNKSIGTNIYDSEMVMQEAFSSKNKLKSQFTRGLNRSQISDLTNEITSYNNWRHDYVCSDASYFSDPETMSYHRNFSQLNNESKNNIRLNKVATWFADRISATNEYVSDGAPNVFFKVSDTTNLTSSDLYYFNNDARIQEGYEFTPDKLSGIFDYSYDLTIGRATKIRRSLNVEDFDLKSKHTIDLDFSNTVLHAMDSQGYRPEHYGIGEIFPNYTLLAKVAKVDFETNSHYAYLDVELGIKDNSSGEEAWLNNLDTSDNAVNPANPVNYNKVIPIELTEQNIRQVAIDHYQDSDAYVDIPSDSSKYTAAIGESSKIVLTDKGTGNNANFDHAEDVASYLDNFFGDNIIGNWVNKSFNTPFVGRKESDEENNNNNNNSNSILSFMPSVSDYVLDNMTVDGKIYENQFVFFKIVSVEQSTETQLKFDLQYIIQDKKENSEFYDPSLKTLKFKFNGSLTSLDTIEFTLNTSPSFNLKKSIMIAAIERYSELNVMYHDFLKLWDVSKIDNYQGIWDCNVSRYVFHTIINAIINALVVIQALASFVAGPLAIALLLFYSAALVMSVVELVYLGMHLNYTNGIQKPMLEAFIGSPSLINRIQDYIAYGDSINMQYFSQRIDEGLSLPQMVSLVNEFYDKTDNFGSLYFHNAPIYAALNSWANSDRVKNNIALNNSKIISAYDDSTNSFKSVMDAIEWSSFDPITNPNLVRDKVEPVLDLTSLSLFTSAVTIFASELSAVLLDYGAKEIPAYKWAIAVASSIEKLVDACKKAKDVLGWLLATAGQSPMAGMNNGFLLYCMIHYPAALDMTLLGLKGLLHNFIKKHATLASMYQRIGPVKLVLQAIDVIVSELIINQIIKGMISTNWNK